MAQIKSAPGMERFTELFTQNHCACVSGYQHTKQSGVTASYQPFGSMPRDCSSLRSTRFIQVASDASPSCFATSSSCARKSSGKRIWYCGDLFSDCVDMVLTITYYHYVVTTIVTTDATQNNAPPVLRARAGRLTNTLIGVTLWLSRSVTKLTLKK